jgi:predicted HTH transcriptional regulator
LSDIESIDLEFKNYLWPIENEEIIFTIQKTICSFLNSKGGILLFGIKDWNCKVEGMNLTQKDKNDFQLLLDGILNKFYPKLDKSNDQVKI